MPIDRVGDSLSVMVPVPVVIEIGVVVGFGLLILTLMVSSGSSIASPVTETSKVLLVSPALNVSVLPVMRV